jgi:hypothetical protein
MTVHVVAQIASHDELHKILDGWQGAMAGDGGAEWLAERLRAAGVATGPGDPTPDDGVDVRPGIARTGRQVGAGRSSSLARNCVAMLFEAMSESCGINSLPTRSSVSRAMITAKRNPEKTS